MKFAIIVFPGSNCDHDVYHAVRHGLEQPAEFIWHKETSLDGFDAVILPGGFSYGDYLRAGAIAHFSPIMKEVVRLAERGNPVLGICNGFQILTENGLLPGALLRNRDLRFVCRHVFIRTENNATIFTSGLQPGQVLRIPVAHGEGNYFINPDGLKELQDNDRIVFRYCGANGGIEEKYNPNGSLDNIAGIINRTGNVLGMMPHPERAMEQLLKSADGQLIFESMLS